MSAPFLADKSALARWHRPLVSAVIDPLHERGLLAICPAVEYELMYSIRGNSEAPTVAEWLRGFDYFHCDDRVFDRALEVQRAAIERGFHRALSLPDLLVAATTERNDATVPSCLMVARGCRRAYGWHRPQARALRSRAITRPRDSTPGSEMHS